MRPPSTELLGIVPLNRKARNGVTKRHQTFHAVTDDFMSASLLCPAASHSYGDNYEHQSSSCDYRQNFHGKILFREKSDLIDKVMRVRLHLG